MTMLTSADQTQGKRMEPEDRLAEAPGEVNFVERAHGLGALIEPLAAQIEQTKRLPEALLERLHDAGLFRMLLPRAYGGFEIPPSHFAQTLNAIAQYDASTAWCTSGSAGRSPYGRSQMSSEGSESAMRTGSARSSTG